MRIPLLQSKRIERFAWFDAWLGRGGQPNPRTLQTLRDQGVGIVVNLRTRDEREMVERAGMRGVHIPVKNDGAPTEEQVLQWLELCRANRETQRIYVHCKAGEGRTSAFCAAVRLAQGWTISDAIAEERSYDFAPEGKHAAQARFLVRFAGRVALGVITIPSLSPGHDEHPSILPLP